ncbi:stationary phase inducible protein CsiE [Serratia sp. UGAL515B_01]|uniref:stationary phase inducible protein CsiE n=1 Tax=Serratia sp. UGAL515B_01 TaxID=2986763 RepID=UPI002953B404|nr:stationary phase inducible protein CsiE [Serratia sp. UGAL515B_01]WON75892.1 stationary phase inducible protein CsiE [Serratia sp. UGAL515B_01]
MSTDISSAPALSGQQRRCHLLLMLFAPTPKPKVQLETISQINGVGQSVTRQDIAEVATEIQRLYHLKISSSAEDTLQIQGSALNQRLCLFQWLRRTLRCSPQFVEQNFALRYQQALSLNQVQIATLELCINECEQQLNRHFSQRDRQFLYHYLCYCVWARQHQPPLHFDQTQRQWLRRKPEQRAAAKLQQTLSQSFDFHANIREGNFLTLMFTLLKNHSYQTNGSPEDRRLMATIEKMVAYFQQISGMSFNSQEELNNQLFAHLAHALERCRFNIGVDNSVLEELLRKYPRLMRTTQKALLPFEQEYEIHFSREEVGLLAISFGAWMMQDNAVQETQILLLTRDNPQLEAKVEDQLRELTLLPLNIKYLPLSDYQRSGAPPGITVVITPYVSIPYGQHPPLMQTELPLTHQQRQVLCALLEKH